jgi:CubicO group peptidase (beta-lactamase class C family)
MGVHARQMEHLQGVVRETMLQNHIPGLSLAVIDHGQLVWAQGFGWRDRSGHFPVDTNTQFQAGSISKPVSALGILLLQAEGRVDLDADVNRYLKGWQLESKFTNGPVTLRQLLCHRAGVTPHGFLGFRESKIPPTLLEVLNRHYFFNGPIRVKYLPGSKYEYSGGGYCVAQKVIEDVAGQPFETAMAQRLFQPLGMHRSDFSQPPADISQLAQGHSGLGQIIFPGRWRLFPQKAAAGLWTTPSDLARLIVALQTAMAGKGGPVISWPIAQACLTPQFDDWQGIGFRLDARSNDRGFYHYGENIGYHAGFGAGVSNGRAWVIMTNTHKNKLDPILNAIAEEFGWTPLPRDRPVRDVPSRNQAN